MERDNNIATRLIEKGNVSNTYELDIGRVDSLLTDILISFLCKEIFSKYMTTV
tara:strand:+ start:396 stop:554 length:159 start_codon:yes stop_codon:yes gene_type:complete